MVLSNKKLKQRLRSELLSKAVNESGSKSCQDAILKPESLRTLLNSATQKPRLSKREKKRKAISVDGSNELKSKPDENAEEKRRNGKESQVNDGTNEQKRKKKEKKENRKRKREEEGAVDVKESGSSELKIGKKKKKRKKKKQKQHQKEKEKEKGNEREVEEVPQIDNATDSQVNGDASTKVYVGGIPYSYAEEDIQYYFQSCGSIVGIDCMKFSDTGKFRGIVIISFESEDGAKNALMYDRAEMGGLQLTIQPYKSTRVNRASGFAPKMVEGYNRVYVGNLSWDITEDDLKKFFCDCSISSIRFGMDKESGEFRGYAHVDFCDSVSVAMALKLNQEYVCGRPVKISCAVPPKGGKVITLSLPDTKTNNEVRSHLTPLAASNEASDGAEDATATTTDAKVRRRTCYECGEKGHLSSACPKKQNVEKGGKVRNISLPDNTTSNEVKSHSTPLAASNEVSDGAIDATATATATTTTTAKIKRRTCYECGEKGHLSSACPKKRNVEKDGNISLPDNTTSNEVKSHSTPLAASNEVSDGAIDATATATATTATTAKIKRRTCYECGEKGHLSAACPKKQNVDPAKASTI